MMQLARAQGATEYLVLLAVVLIVALVSVALLGFFPGMASDAQITQSQTYWRSASPVAITEWGALAWGGSGNSYPYLRLRNNGQYPIRITGIIGSDGVKATSFWANSHAGCSPATVGTYLFNDYYYMAPGEEKYVGWSAIGGLACDYEITAYAGVGTSGMNIGTPSPACQNSTTAPGTLQFSSFGFEYIEYVENQQITKREIGKPVVIKCSPASP